MPSQQNQRKEVPQKKAPAREAFFEAHGLLKPGDGSSRADEELFVHQHLAIHVNLNHVRASLHRRGVHHGEVVSLVDCKGLRFHHATQGVHDGQ